MFFNECGLKNSEIETGLGECSSLCLSLCKIGASVVAITAKQVYMRTMQYFCYVIVFSVLLYPKIVHKRAAHYE